MQQKNRTLNTFIKASVLSLALPLSCVSLGHAESFGHSFLYSQNLNSDALSQALLIANQEPTHFSVITNKIRFEQQERTNKLLQEMVQNQKMIIQLLKAKG